MKASTVVIVTGHPGTGKTTLGKRLAADLSTPYLYKDGIKEVLYEALGWDDRAWSRQLGAASYGMLYHVLESLVSAGADCVCESNFSNRPASQELSRFRRTYQCGFVQIHLLAQPEVLLERYHRRDEGTGRHRGHHDREGEHELEERLQRGDSCRLQLDGPTLDLDTTDFSSVNYEAVVKWVRNQKVG